MDIDSIIKNIKEMLVQRGDNIDEFEEHEKDIEREEFLSDNRILEFHSSNTTIIFAMTKKLKKTILDELKSYQSDLMKFIFKYNNKKNFILVLNNDIISAPIIQQINKYDKFLQKNGGILQYFYAKQLSFNPTKHEYVPLHEKVPEDKVQEILDQYSITSKLKLSWIYHSDPQAKWLGLKQGDIVRITSYNSNSGTYYRYRCCI